MYFQYDTLLQAKLLEKYPNLFPKLWSMPIYKWIRI
jgi:hypothetical protein